ncbi:hypothetical protein KAR91_78390 [Candidatus Pacearchaeota archaeon]|nr:hypothetical protein [Candidatus Pacearchaeota archaeon]
MSNFLFDTCELRPSGIIFRPEYEHYSGSSYSDRSNNFDLSSIDSKQRGFLSYNSIRRMKFALELLIASSVSKKAWNYKTQSNFNFRVNFVTLTMSATDAQLSDKYIKQRMLKVFFQYAKRYWGVRSYVWKAESQSNGRIHFHITSDQWIEWKELRTVWNKIQTQHGIIDIYRKNMLNWHSKGFHIRDDLKHKWPVDQQRAAYKLGMFENWNNPNSTDVHSVKNIRNLPAYLIKYMIKSEEKYRDIDGRLWGCSKNLNGDNRCHFDAVEKYGKEFYEIEHNLKAQKIERDFFNIIPLSPDDFKNNVKGNLLNLWKDYLHDVRSN